MRFQSPKHSGWYYEGTSCRWRCHFTTSPNSRWCHKPAANRKYSLFRLPVELVHPNRSLYRSEAEVNLSNQLHQHRRRSWRKPRRRLRRRDNSRSRNNSWLWRLRSLRIVIRYGTWMYDVCTIYEYHVVRTMTIEFWYPDIFPCYFRGLLSRSLILSLRISL